jgi:predicted hotdog family 3-hydroxylacyl-ACP dehydratase
MLSGGLLDRDGIAARIPHAGAMVLLDTIVDSDAETILARTESHRRTDNPLLRDGRLHAIAGSEYGAQAAAVHGPLQAGPEATARPGMIVSLRDLSWTRARLDDIDGPLEVRATRLMADTRQLAYAFTLAHAGTTLVEGEVGIILS